MKTLHVASLVLLGTLLSCNTFAHGLNKVGDKAILFKQHGSLLVKAEMTPNSVNYNTDNSLYLSIIDQEAGRFYQGEVIASLSPADQSAQDHGAIVMSFDQGVSKTKLQLTRGGSYLLTLNFNNATGMAPIILDLQLDDNRLFARTVLVVTVVGTTILIIYLAFFFSLRKREPTEAN